MKKLLIFCFTLVSIVANAQADKFKKDIIGKWQSMNDPKSVELYTETLAISEYDGKRLETLSYNITYNKDNEHYIISKYNNSDADATVYSIVKLDNNYMELSLLGGRGNTLKYKKVSITNPNPVTTGKLMTVISAKANFYTKPDIKTMKKAYLIKGQQISAGKEQNNFINATFVNDKGVKTIGWLRKSDLK